MKKLFIFTLLTFSLNANGLNIIAESNSWSQTKRDYCYKEGLRLSNIPQKEFNDNAEKAISEFKDISAYCNAVPDSLILENYSKLTDSYEMIAYCASVNKTAKVVMDARQIGMAKNLTTLTLHKKARNQDEKAAYTKLIKSAYDLPVQKDKGGKEIASTVFSDEWGKRCIINVIQAKQDAYMSATTIE